MKELQVIDCLSDDEFYELLDKCLRLKQVTIVNLQDHHRYAGCATLAGRCTPAFHHHVCEQVGPVRRSWYLKDNLHGERHGGRKTTRAPTPIAMVMSNASAEFMQGTRGRRRIRRTTTVMNTGAVIEGIPKCPAAITGACLLQQRDGRGWLLSCSSTCFRTRCWDSDPISREPQRGTRPCLTNG